MDPVTILIFNSLVRKESVYLPQIGLLRVTANPVMRHSDGSTAMVKNDVQLYETGDGADIIELIMMTASKDREDAQHIYNRWLSNANDKGVIRIESVGTISDGHFMMDRGLLSALNPAAPMVKKVPRQHTKRKVNFTMVIVLAAIVGAAISIGVITYLDHENRYEKKFNTSEATAVVQVTAETQNAATEAGSAGVSGGAGEATAVVASGKDAMSEATKPQVSAVTTETAKPQATATTQKAVTPAASANGPGYYVIIGNYSTDENASRFIAECRQKDNMLQYNKLPLPNGKIMVYTSKWGTQAEANANRNLASYPEAWVYKYGG